MDSFQTVMVCSLATLVAGVVVACFTHRAPKRGWVGVILLLVAAGAVTLSEPGDSAHPSNLPMFLVFLFVAPVAVVYAFRARKTAPDRRIALAAFAGACFISVFLLWMTVALVFAMFEFFGSGH